MCHVANTHTITASIALGFPAFSACFLRASLLLFIFTRLRVCVSVCECLLSKPNELPNYAEIALKIYIFPSLLFCCSLIFRFVDRQKRKRQQVLNDIKKKANFPGCLWVRVRKIIIISLAGGNLICLKIYWEATERMNEGKLIFLFISISNSSKYL